MLGNQLQYVAGTHGTKREHWKEEQAQAGDEPCQSVACKHLRGRGGKNSMGVATLKHGLANTTKRLDQETHKYAVCQ